MTWNHGDSRAIGVHYGIEVIATCEVENGRRYWSLIAKCNDYVHTGESCIEAHLDDVAQEVAGELALELFPNLLEASK